MLQDHTELRLEDDESLHVYRDLAPAQLDVKQRMMQYMQSSSYLLDESSVRQDASFREKQDDLLSPEHAKLPSLQDNSVNRS